METKFKNVLITGASSGIGEAMALYYAASGSENLFICGRNKERLNEVKHQCEKFGAKVYASLIDVNDREKMRAWINQSNKKAALNPCFFIPSIRGRRKAQYRRRKQPYFWYGKIIILRLFGSEKDMQKIVYSCEKTIAFREFHIAFS